MGRYYFTSFYKAFRADSSFVHNSLTISCLPLNRLYDSLRLSAGPLPRTVKIHIVATRNLVTAGAGHQAGEALDRDSMADITRYVPIHTQPGSRTLSEILHDEQMLATARRKSAMVPNQGLTRAELEFASDEERQGASILRELMHSMEIIVADAEVTIIRLIIRNRTLDQLELWGAYNVDYEPTFDFEPGL